ncbi:MAG TPA: Smr/MutS family protein [Alphaproteobacteria bacterium]|nr:Smr/MutS family protein [Alphaproteobacteria bacterium]
MRDVEAWRKSESPPDNPPPPAASKPKDATAPARRKSGAEPRRPEPALAPGDVIGVDRRLAERLKRGRLPIQSSLDLHGLTQAEAHAAVEGFIARAADRGWRTVLIVTGKGRRDGGGILKTALPRWLNEASLRGHVLALAEARPEHGGAGALYVLLRRRRRG